MRPRILAAVAGLALVASACGESDKPVEEQAPVTTTVAEAEPADDMAEESDESETVDNTAVDGVAEVPLLVEMEIEEALAELERAYEERLLNPYIAAERGTIDAVIDPADSRREVAAAFEMLAGKRERLPRRRHDNSPL